MTTSITTFDLVGDIRFLFPVLLTALFAFGVHFFAFATDAKLKRRKAIKNDILKGIQKGRLQWEDLEYLCQRWKQSRTDLHWILSDVLHESLSGDSDEDGEQYEQVKKLLAEQQKAEPFAELPESIRIHIEQVSSRFREGGDEVVRPLASSICDTIIEADRRNEKQKTITKYSFIIGLVSLLLGIVSLLFAVAQLSDQRPTTTETIEQTVGGNG